MLKLKKNYSGAEGLTRLECMHLSNTTLFDGRFMYRIYNIKYNYMFRRLTMAIFRLYIKYLVGSYTRLISRSCAG